ncbi:toxin-antitoxin system, toxin component, YafQ family [Campylobacter pinnipediorum subsp. pinnipediorum]|uniref:type II toxin-antitoxin system YafQ family toxin n=1 Tax=Campylobacter pinnipediorum TaxID=1965231 RepID=UPI000995A28A|nr:type II toxin-antitoxin system YafQ family toxin [Campylobacter pinnipediorum]AQW80950.1 toxin-antitoxin system, toxin component, YafQ family [Campylobacter pinnipediorum subsp. pinnipediorum]
MIEIKFSNKFKSDYKNLKKQGFDDDLLIDFLEHLKLVDKISLPVLYKNHSLKGDYKGFFDCHLKSDCVVIYRINNNIVELARIGSHSKIFKKY